MGKKVVRRSCGDTSSLESLSLLGLASSTFNKGWSVRTTRVVRRALCASVCAKSLKMFFVTRDASAPPWINWFRATASRGIAALTSSSTLPRRAPRAGTRHWTRLRSSDVRRRACSHPPCSRVSAAISLLVHFESKQEFSGLRNLVLHGKSGIIVESTSLCCFVENSRGCICEPNWYDCTLSEAITKGVGLKLRPNAFWIFRTKKYYNETLGFMIGRKYSSTSSARMRTMSDRSNHFRRNITTLHFGRLMNTCPSG